VLERLPQRLREQFPGHDGFSIAPPQTGELPTYLVCVALYSPTPVRDATDSDYSGLVHCWMVDALPTDLATHLADQVMLVNWDRYAVNGTY